MTKNILIVEDDVDCRSQLDMQLQRAGYKVKSAFDAPGATEAFGAQRPDLAIVDLMLEHMDDGFVLCHRFKKMDAGVPIILMTAVTRETGMNFDVQTDEERNWIKADALLHKPFRFEVLHAEIQRLMKAGGDA